MKTKFRVVSLVMALAMAVGVLAGCSGSSSSSGSTAASGSTTTSGASTAGKTDLVIVMPEDLETFDPVNSSARCTMAITRMLYTTLYVPDAEGQPQPLLAESMDVISDTELHFNLVKGAKFSDGSEITADDVVASLNRALASPNFSTLMGAIESFEKVDDYTVKAVTSGPAPSIQLALSHNGTSILPAEYIEEAEASGDWSNPICSGPYVLDHRTIGQEVKVVKNEDYFCTERAAQNTSITFKYVPEASSRTIMVETGEADANYMFAAADKDTVAGNSDLTLHTNTGTVVSYFGFDTTMAPFDDVRVRQAMCYAFDREAIIDIVCEGLGKPSYTIMPPSTLGYVENAGGYSYDPEKAKELLAEAGYADGFTTDLVVFNDAGAAAAPVLQNYLAAVGITANIQRYESSVRMDMLANHEVPTFFGSWGAMSDADLVLPRLFTEAAIGGMNFSFWYDEECTALLEEARNTYDTEERVSLYNEAVTMIDQDAAWAPLYIADVFGLTRADLQGVVLDGEGLIDFWALHY